jgi:serine protease Do
MIRDPGLRTPHPRILRPILALALLAPALPPAASASNPRRTPVVEAVERVRPAVVNIHSERMVRTGNADAFAQSAPANRVNGMGTGVVIDPRGYIVTNNHVVEDVNSLRIRLNDGSSHAALVVARDPESDLALLKIEAGRPLPTAPLGTARDVMVGETVIAIGNAFGYEHSVTTGIVSAVKRDVTLNKEISYKSLIQTDASINPGNSGGPLLNINGEMIGVNVAIRAGAQGISFAIPVDTVIRVASELLAARKRPGLWHGLVCHDRVTFGPTDLKLQSSLDRGEGDGKADAPEWKRELVVDRVEPSSPAEKSGVRPGDVVVRVGVQEIRNSLDLARALLEANPGDQFPVVVRRKGETQSLDLALAAPDRSSLSHADVVWRKMGVRLQPVNSDVVARSSPQLHGGLTVVEVTPGGVADRSGILRGDILVGLHLWETLSLDNAAFVLSHPDLNSFSPLTFYVLRNGQVRRGTLQPAD